MSKYFVYGLFDVETAELFYIGKTKDIERRKESHLSGYFSNDASIFAARGWNRLHDLRDVDIRIISMHDSKRDALAAEKEKIQQCAKDDYPLINCQHFYTAKNWHYGELDKIFSKMKWHQACLK